MKRFSKWGFSGQDDKSDSSSTPDAYSQTTDDQYSMYSNESFNPSICGHQPSTSFDSHVKAMEHSRTQKKHVSTPLRPATEYISYTQNNLSSLRNSVPVALPPLRTALVPHLHNLMKPGAQIAYSPNDLMSSDSLLNTADELLLQMLLSKSFSVCQTYGVLPLQQLDTLKKEEEALKLKVTSLTTKLSLESKVKEGAQTLIRLHAANKKILNQAQDQLNAAQHKMDEIAKELWYSQHRWWEIQRVMNEHHAAVLGVAYQRQEKEINRMKESLKLREGQIAVADNSFFDGNVDSSRFQNDSSNLQIIQDRLNLALSTDNKKHQYTDDLVLNHLKVEIPGLDTIESEFEESQKQANSLENPQPSTQPSLCNTPSSVDPEEIYSKLSNLETSRNTVQEELFSLKEQHAGLLSKLETLFFEIPGPELEDDFSGVTFSVDDFIQRVDNLVEENHDLIDRVLALQSTQPLPTKENTDQFKTQIKELQKSLSNSQTLIVDLEAKLEKAAESQIIHKEVSPPVSQKVSHTHSVSKNTGMYVARGSTLQAELAAIVEGLGQVTSKARGFKDEKKELLSEREELLSKIQETELVRTQLEAELDLKFKNENSESRREMRMEFRHSLKTALSSYQREAASLAAQNRALRDQIRGSISRSPVCANSLVI